jgi:cysteine desulfurase/selenocysteine lyase
MSQALRTEPAANLDWSALRDRYPAAKRWVFLNAGSRGLLSTTAHAAGVASLGSDLTMTSDDPPAPAQLAELRQLFARLINAGADEIAVTKNVSEGLNLIANAIDWQAGDNVVLTSDVEHANNIYLWLALARRGVEVRDVPTVGGAIDPKAMAAAIDARTRIVAASAVTFTPGFRTALAPIGRAARAAGALFLVDGVQACGVIEVDVERDQIDALATSTSKGLLGVRGLGFLYVRRAWVPKLTPVHVARNSIDTKGKHYSEFEGGSFELWPDARRFEAGTYNFAGVAIARAALREILEIGIPQIERRAVGLATQLANGLRAQGWPVVEPPAGTERSHLVVMGERGPGGPEATGDPRLDRLASLLEANNVRFSVRRRLLRFGFHFYNDESDVDAVLSLAGRVARN